MAYTPVPLVKRGDLWTAAQHNTYIKDNMAMTGAAVVTAKGDMLYASAANTPARLAIGANSIMKSGSAVPAWKAIGDPFDKLRTNSDASDIEWATFPLGEICTRSANQAIAQNTSTAISFSSADVNLYSMWSAGNPTRITIPSGLPNYVYRISGCASTLTTSSCIHQINVQITRGGASLGIGEGRTDAGYGTTYKMSFCYERILYAGDYLELIAYHGQSGGANYFDCKFSVVLLG